MPATRRVFPAALLLCALVLSCDDFAPEGGAPPPGAGDPEGASGSDPKCVSLAGERLEKYYYQLDPASYDAPVSLSSPSVLGHECRDGTGAASYGFNQISLQELPLRLFAEGAPFEHRVSGTVAVSGKAEGLRAAYSMPFEKTALLSPRMDYNGTEPLGVLNTFANAPGDLALALTGSYGSLARKEGLRVFSMAFSSDFLGSCVGADKFSVPCGPSDGETEFAVDGVYPADLTATGSAYVPLVPASRNFYQYTSLTATFSPGAFIADVKAAPIVKGYNYDPALNSLSVAFADYDFPYAGDVVSYSIGAGEQKDGAPTQRKAIRIVGR